MAEEYCDFFYQNLMEAIIDRATMDLTLMEAGLLDENNLHNIDECIDFFYTLYGDVKGSQIIETCQKAAKKIVLKYVVDKNRHGRWYVHPIHDNTVIGNNTYKKKQDATDVAAELNGVSKEIYNRMLQNRYIWERPAAVPAS